MLIDINLGLKIDRLNHVLPVEVALAVLASHGLFTADAAPRVAQSETEATLVARVLGHSSHAVNRNRLSLVAEALLQDAIAVVWPGDIGELIGPNTAAWGAFDPAAFIPVNAA